MGVRTIFAETCSRAKCMASRRGPIYRAQGVEGGSCGRMPLSTGGRDKSGPYGRSVLTLHDEKLV